MDCAGLWTLARGTVRTEQEEREAAGVSACLQWLLKLIWEELETLPPVGVLAFVEEITSPAIPCLRDSGKEMGDLVPGSSSPLLPRQEQSAGDKGETVKVMHRDQGGSQCSQWAHLLHSQYRVQ